MAVLAAQLAREQPDLTPKQLRAAMIANGAPGELAPDRTGGGVAEGGRQAITADPSAPVSGALDPISVDLNATSSTQVTLRASDGATATPPAVSLVPGTSKTIRVRLARAGTTFGRLEVLEGGAVAASVPWLIRPDTVEPVAVGELKVTGGRRVRFTLGAFKRGAGDRGPGRGAADPRPRRRQGRDPPQPHRPWRRSRADAGRVRLHDPARLASRRRLRLPRPRLGARAGRADRPPLRHTAPVRKVTLYSRAGCHLCDEAREALERVHALAPFVLEEVDIEADDALHARYLERIPVIALDGEELFDYFVDETALVGRILYRECG